MFCSEPNDERNVFYDLTKPVILDEYTVATDIMTMAWVHEHLPEASAPEKEYPKFVLEMISEFDAIPDDQFMPVNFTPAECEHKACPTCNGKRHDFLVRCFCGGYEKYCGECKYFVCGDEKLHFRAGDIHGVIVGLRKDK
jgi:hypothetical protein